MKRNLRNRTALVIVLASWCCACGRGREHWLAKGNQFFAQGKYEDASLNYRKALQSDPRFGEAYYRLGLSETRLGHATKAWAALSRAAELLPQNLEVAAQLGEAYLRDYEANRSKAAYDRMAAIANRLLAHDPNSFTGLRLKGYQAVADAKPDQAIEYLARANAVRPLVPDVAITLAESLILAKRGEEAERLLRQVLDRHPDFGPAYDTLYSYYLQAGRNSEAERTLIAKSAKNPADDFPVVQLAEYYWRHNQPEQARHTIQQLIADRKRFPRAYLATADFYKQTGNWDQAVAALEAGAQANPGQKAFYEKHVIETLLQQGNARAALERLNGLVSEFPSDDDLKGTWATLLVDGVKHSDLDRARNALEELLKRSPDNVTFRYQLGRAYAGEGRYAEARQQFENVVARQPNHLMARVGLAEVASRTQDFVSCLHWVEQVLALKPEMPNAHLLKATALVGLGRLDEARAEYRRLVDEHPKYREARLQLALLDVLQKRYPEAEKGFRENYEPAKGDFRALKGLLEVYSAEGRQEQALALLQKETAQHPDSLELRAMNASWAARTGKWDVAAREYERVRAARPDDPAVLMALGEAYRRQADWENAGQAFAHAQALSPNDWQPPFLLGYVHQMEGRLDEAQTDYRNCLRLNPNYPEALNNLAFLLAEQNGPLDEALALSRKASEADRNNSRFTDTTGWIYLKQGRLDAAEQVFTALVRKDPQDGLFRFHLGLVLHRKGDRADARRELQAAVKAGLPQSEKSTAAQLLSTN